MDFELKLLNRRLEFAYSILELTKLSGLTIRRFIFLNSMRRKLVTNPMGVCLTLWFGWSFHLTFMNHEKSKIMWVLIRADIV